jgi:hypothetical protein
MKLNFKLIISVLITSVLAADKNDASGIPKACITEMMKIEKCISPKITKENINMICTTTKSQECQQFFTNPMSLLPSCQKFSELIKISTKIFNNSLSLMCENDESGNLCPFTEYEIAAADKSLVPTNSLVSNISNTIPTGTDAISAIKSSCSSAKCKAATLKYVQFLIDSNNDVTKIIEANYKFAALQNANAEVLSELKSFLEILNGKECGVVAPPPAISMVNDTSVMTNNTIQANQLKGDQNSNGLTRYITKPTIISFIIYMILYCLMFKFILI